MIFITLVLGKTKKKQFKINKELNKPKQKRTTNMLENEI